ncbi:MAG: hypothetical protein WCG75_11175 [Armatimonadota bacterium]
MSSDESEFKCPYCGQMVPAKTMWCSTCGAKIQQSPGKYPISTVWIVVVMLILPFAISSGCAVENGKYFADFLVLAIIGLTAVGWMIAYNLKVGRK